MAANTISLTFKLEELNGGFKQITADAEGFKRVMAATVTPAEELTNKLGNFASTSVVFTAMADAIQQLNSTVNDLTAAYAVQEQAETQLQTVMQQRMNATAADVQAIKDLCSAQQKLGVIGDEVQLAGAQQIATFLREKSSLEVLIPAMNDLVAQQHGLNATSADAVSAANLMGKAMQGQTSALRRVGITFTEAQAEVMKFGTESEKAAMLVEIITDNFGHMNTELAKTDSGKLKQVKNDLGDVKETLGGLVSSIAPYLNVVSSIAISAVAVVKLTTALKGTIIAVKSWSLVQMAHNKIMATFNTTTAVGAVRVGMFSSALGGVPSLLRTITMGFRTATAAAKGLMVVTGVGAAWLALTSIMEAFVGSADDAADASDRLTDSQREQSEAAKAAEEAQKAGTAAGERAKIQIDQHIQAIKNFKGSKQEEKKLLTELGNTYGDTMGYFKNLSSWYDALISNSADYCRQMLIEAETRAYADQIARGKAEYRALTGKNYDPKTSWDEQNELVGSTYDQMQLIKATNYRANTFFWEWGDADALKEQHYNSALEKNNNAAKARDIAAGIASSEAGLQESLDTLSKINFRVRGTAAPGAGVSTGGGGGSSNTEKEKTRLQELNAEIDKYKEKWVEANEADRPAIKEKIDGLQKERDELDLLIASLERPKEFNTLADFDKELAYLEKARQYATQDKIPEIDKQINSTKSLKASIELAAHREIAPETLQSYDQLNEELAYYNTLLNSGDANIRKFAQKNINALDKIKKSWEDALKGLSSPKDLSELKTLEDLSEARKHYTDLQQKADADEFLRLQEIINAIDKKTEALQRGTLIADNKQELNTLSSLSGEPLRLELQAIGFEAIEEKIKSLQALLSDTANPLSDSMKEIVDGQIKQYEGFSKNKAFGGISKETKKTLGYVDEMGAAFKTIGSNIGVPALDVMGTIAQAIANLILSYSQATAESASLGPFGWMAFSMAGLATLTSIVGSVKGLSAFADGGIVSGPTLGLVGEYAGASHNPEVIAPLNKLKTLIEPRDNVIGGHVEFEIEGRKLKGVLQRVNNLSIRS